MLNGNFKTGSRVKKKKNTNCVLPLKMKLTRINIRIVVIVPIYRCILKKILMWYVQIQLWEGHFSYLVNQ